MVTCSLCGKRNLTSIQVWISNDNQKICKQCVDHSLSESRMIELQKNQSFYDLQARAEA